MPHWVYYFNFSILLYNSWRLMSGSGKHLIKIRGHRSQDKLQSSICLLFSAFFSGMILSNVFFYFHIFFHFFQFQSFTQTLISLLSVLSFDHDFHQLWDSSLQCSLFLKTKILKYIVKVYSIFQTWKLFKNCFFTFHHLNLNHLQLD